MLEVHAYNTRASTDLHVIGPRSTYGQSSIRYKGSVLWNRLPATLKLPSSITVYRAKRMHSADYAVARCLSVCLSQAGIESKRL